MEDSCFRALMQYFTYPVIVINEDKIKVAMDNVPFELFYTYSYEKASDYIGELNRNNEKYGPSGYLLNEVSNHRFKFEDIFSHEFGFEYSNEEAKEKYLHQTIPELDRTTRLQLEAKRIKIGIYRVVLDYIFIFLDGKVLSPPEGSFKPSRKKMILRDFHLKFKEENLTELLAMLKEGGYISPRTDINEFIRAHTGLPVENKFTWLKDQHSLYLFIRNLIGNDCFFKKPGHGIWDIVAELYKPHDETSYFPEKLMHSSGTKGKSYDDIADIVESISEIDNDL